MNIEMPCEPRGFVGACGNSGDCGDSRDSRDVFAATKYTSASTPLVMNILLPLSTQPSPLASRTARVRMPATSDPASGSVTATAVIFSPRTIDGM